MASPTLIETDFPVAIVNAAIAREWKAQQGHPKMLHLWWSRKPLAATGAVLFAQLVTDPSAWPALFPTAAAQAAERSRLYAVMARFIDYDNLYDTSAMEAARYEVALSHAHSSAATSESARAFVAKQQTEPLCAADVDTYLREHMPPVHDPFAGGGGITFSAQRLGLRVHAGDLNPVAVLLNRALLDLPQRFAHRGSALAHDVATWSLWLRRQMASRLASAYAPVLITPARVALQPELGAYLGQHLNVVAWLHCRTLPSPSPAFASIRVPLLRTFWLSSKPGRLAWLRPERHGAEIRLRVCYGEPPQRHAIEQGYRADESGFYCALSGEPIRFGTIRDGAARLETRIYAIVCESKGKKVYLEPTAEDIQLAAVYATWEPEGEIADDALGFRVPNYGLRRWSQLYTSRQLLALTTLADLIRELPERIADGARAAGDTLALGGRGPYAYGQAIAVFAALAFDRCADYWSCLGGWQHSNESLSHLFTQQAIPMAWQFPEANPLSDRGGSLKNLFAATCKAIPQPLAAPLPVTHAAAATQGVSGAVVSTDPPYFDNIGYGDLSDYFYVWLRPILGGIYPDLFGTLQTPKTEELGVSPKRYGGVAAAQRAYFVKMNEVVKTLRVNQGSDAAFTMYFAYKQGASKASASPWERLLSTIIENGLCIAAVWPLQTEKPSRKRKQGSNAMSASLVLVCRPRAADAAECTEREFRLAVERDLPSFVATQQPGLNAIDLAQVALSRGIAIYATYKRVWRGDGTPLSVADAIHLISTVRAAGEAFDAITHVALTWYGQYGLASGAYGEAERLCKAHNIAVDDLVAHGVMIARGGVASLVPRHEGAAGGQDDNLTLWTAAHQAVHLLAHEGEAATARYVAQLGPLASGILALVERLCVLSTQRGLRAEANGESQLIEAWRRICELVAPQATGPVTKLSSRRVRATRRSARSTAEAMTRAGRARGLL